MKRLKLLITMMVLLSAMIFAETPVVAIKTPNGGNQPRALIDEKGNIHLIYFQGDQNSGNLFYMTRQVGKEEYSKPIQVNSVSGSVCGGIIRSGQMSLGKDGRVHVVWNGSKNVKSNMEHTCLNDAGKEFEPEKGLMQASMALDGSGAVASDDKGNVYVTWHGYKLSDKMVMDESQRLVWISISKDNGKTFSKESLAWATPTGVCGCCAMQTTVDKNGSIYIMYRSNSGGNRDMYLLMSKDGGKSFQGGDLHPWKVGMCPASAIGFAVSQEYVATTWETDGQIFFSKIRPGAPTSVPQSVPQLAIAGPNFKKYSSVAINAKGEMLIAWWEGKGKGFWKQNGGDVVWQVYDNKGKPTAEKGRVASDGTPSIVASNDGFTIFH